MVLSEAEGFPEPGGTLLSLPAADTRTPVPSAHLLLLGRCSPASPSSSSATGPSPGLGCPVHQAEEAFRGMVGRSTRVTREPCRAPASDVLSGLRQPQMVPHLRGP